MQENNRECFQIRKIRELFLLRTIPNIRYHEIHENLYTTKFNTRTVLPVTINRVGIICCIEQILASVTLPHDHVIWTISSYSHEQHCMVEIFDKGNIDKIHHKFPYHISPVFPPAKANGFIHQFLNLVTQHIVHARQRCQSWCHTIHRRRHINYLVVAQDEVLCL